MIKAALSLFLLSSLLSQVRTSGISEGDTDPWMISCKDECNVERKCDQPDNAFEQSANFYLRLTRWDCPSDCEYVCMRQHSYERKAQGKPMVQYHGKWPFRRIFGFQEIASSVFSLGNFIPYLLGGYAYYKHVPSTYYLKNVFLVYSVIGSLTWICSFIFHCRDTPTTELLDYMFASFTFLSGSCLATIRVADIRSPLAVGLVFAVFALWGLQHWHYMLYVKFDYTYNVLVGVVNGIYQSIAWIYWCLRVAQGRDYTNNILFGYLSLWLAATMEIFDFSPIFFLVDPHSLWHLGTIPLGFLLWNFYIADGIYENNKLEDEKYHLG